MTATIERPASNPAQDAPDRSQSRFLTVMVAVLAVVALGLGAVVLYNLASGDESAVPADVQQVLDDYYDAWETQDGNALRALITDDYSLTEHVYEPDGRQVVVVRDPDNLSLNLDAYTIETFGTPIVTGDGPWFVSVGESWVGEFSRSDGIATYEVVEQDGTLLIARHYWDGQSSALDPRWQD